MRQVLVIGLADTATVEHAKMITGQAKELYPDLDVLVVAGCTSLAVVDLPEQSR